VEVLDGDVKSYRFIPAYDLQTAYLKGTTDTYLVTISL
jgi:hypothetical protein